MLLSKRLTGLRFQQYKNSFVFRNEVGTPPHKMSLVFYQFFFTICQLHESLELSDSHNTYR